MKLLLFSDLHCDVAAAERLVERADQVDVAIGAGDFGSVRKGVDTTVNVLSRITCPTILVPGNAESVAELAAASKAWPSARVLHGSGTKVRDVDFFGLGGAVPVTPFGAWSYDFSEAEAEALLADCPSGAVLVSHSPPRGAVDVSSRGLSLGSTAVRATVERTQPRLVVCGHIHDCAGQSAWIESTPIVNAGPAGVLWDLV